MKPTEKQIEEIAGDLDAGMRCYFNLKTGEIRTIINFDSYIGADEEPWEEELREIDEHRDDYLAFEGFESHESFRIMEDFAETVEDTELRNKLRNVLNRPKPFQNFKWLIDNSGRYRQEWFNYKNKCYIQWVKEQIELNKDFFNKNNRSPK
jgi:hypothetical protein